jgi:hypothetical protein
MCAARASAPRPPVRLLFSALFAAVLAQPTDEPSDHERGQQERDDHAHADEHIGEDDSGAVLDGHAARRRFASMPLYVSRADGLPSSCIEVLLAFMAGGEIGQTIGNGYRRQPAIQNLRLVPGDGLGESSHTGGLRDGNPRRLLRHHAAGDSDGTRTDCPQAAHLIRQLTVRVSSFSHHQPAVMAITKWSIQAPSSKKSPVEAGLRLGRRDCHPTHANLRAKWMSDFDVDQR